MYKSWQLRHATVRDSINCGIARPGIYLKKNNFNFVNPHAAILKTPVWGLLASTALRCVTLFNHMNSGAPYSAIHMYILLKLMISCVGVPELLWSRFNTYNNQRMLYKISQIFCQYIMANFPVPSLPPCIHCVGNLSPAMGAENQVGIGLSYRPASLFSLATRFQTRFLESIPRPIAGLKFSTLFAVQCPCNFAGVFTYIRGGLET